MLVAHVISHGYVLLELCRGTGTVLVGAASVTAHVILARIVGWELVHRSSVKILSLVGVWWSGLPHLPGRANGHHTAGPKVV